MSDISITTSLSGIEQVQAGLKAIGAGAESIQKQFATAAVSIKALGDHITTSGRAVRQMGVDFTLLTAPIAAAGAAAILTSAKFEQTNMAMNTLIGNTKDAKMFLEELKDFAARTPFTFVGIADASKQLMAMGFQARAIIPIMRAVGDATSALGTGQEGINRIVYALGQIHASATLNSQDMRQLQQAFVNGWKYIAQETGKSIMQVKDETAKGMTDSATALTAIIKGIATDPAFKGMMEVQSATLLGVWSNFQDRLGYTLINIGDDITRAFDLKEIANSSIEWLHQLQNWWDSLNDTTKRWTLYISAAAVATGPLLVVIGQMAIGFGGLIKVAGALAAVFASPLVLGITAVVGATAYAISVTGHWGDVIAGLTSTVKSAIPVISSYFSLVQTAITTDAAIFDRLKHLDFKGAWDALSQGLGDQVDIVKGGAADITHIWTTGFNDSKKSADDFLGHMKEVFSSLGNISKASSIDMGPDFLSSTNDQLTNFYYGLDQGTKYSYTLQEALAKLKAEMGGGVNAGGFDRLAQALHLTNEEMVKFYKVMYPDATDSSIKMLNLTKEQSMQLEDQAKKYYPDVIALIKRTDAAHQGLGENWENWRAKMVNGMITFQSIATTAYQTVTSSFGQSVTNMIMNGEKWYRALSDIFKNVLAAFINMVSQMIAEWAIMQVLKMNVQFGTNLLAGGAQGLAANTAGQLGTSYALGQGLSSAGAGTGTVLSQGPGGLTSTLPAAQVPQLLSASGVLAALGTYYLYSQQSQQTKNDISILQPFYDPINTVKQIGSTASDAYHKVKDFLGFARGGEMTVTQPTLFMAGEHAPERVRVSTMASPRGGNDTPTVVFNGPVIMDDIAAIKFSRRQDALMLAERSRYVNG